MAWAWFALILFVLVLAAGAAAVVKLLVTLERKRRASEIPERSIAEFAYTDEEWDYLHKNQFVDDTRGRGILDRDGAVISWLGSRSERSSRGVRFLDRRIQLFGDGEEKSYKVQSLNPGGDSINLQSIRVLKLQPMDKLQIKVGVSLRLEQLQYQRVEFDLEYLIPVPKAASVRLPEIEQEYGELILASTPATTHQSAASVLP